MYRIKQINDREQWQNFVLKQENTLFVQSWDYGEFYKRIGEQFWVFGIYEEIDKKELLVGGSLVLSTHARRGNYLYMPYGPIINSQNYSGALRALTDELRHFVREHEYIFVRASPFVQARKRNKIYYSKLGYRDAPMHALAENTWLLDITPSEEELLANMKKNHRNLINRCVREGVRVSVSDSDRELDQFNDILSQTAKRHGFHRFPQKYIKREFDVFAANKQALILKAYLPDGRLDSASIFIFFGNMSVYRHSGSLNLNKKLPTSYLMQWQAIKEAKRRGMKTHNFWGIAPEEASDRHPFKGITRFKKGFGGYGLNLLRCQDLPLSARYWFTWALETVRRIKRGF